MSPIPTTAGARVRAPEPVSEPRVDTATSEPMRARHVPQERLEAEAALIEELKRQGAESARQALLEQERYAARDAEMKREQQQEFERQEREKAEQALRAQQEQENAEIEAARAQAAREAEVAEAARQAEQQASMRAALALVQEEKKKASGTAFWAFILVLGVALFGTALYIAQDRANTEVVYEDATAAPQIAITTAS